MSSITARNLDDGIETRLRMRAEGNGRSMEQEARAILRDAVAGERQSSAETSSTRTLTSIIRECFGPIGGVDLELPPREPAHEPPYFD